MALQAIDRQKAKHAFKVAPRTQPAMVFRSNKRVKANHAPRQIVTAMGRYFDERSGSDSRDINSWYY
jgi:hypothetical protein